MEIAHFFERYKELEEGKYTEILGWGKAEEARGLILDAMRRYDECFRQRSP